MKRMAYTIAVISILVDQITKYFVSNTMELGQDIPMIQNFFHITYVRNTGAAWSMLEGKMIFFYLVTSIAIGFFIYFIQSLHTNQKLLSFGYGLMLGGALGNFIDRLLFQSVVDFFHFYIVGYDYPVFNVADISLVVGIGFVVLDYLVEYRKEKTNG